MEALSEATTQIKHAITEIRDFAKKNQEENETWREYFLGNLNKMAHSNKAFTENFAKQAQAKKRRVDKGGTKEE
jgi:hypothetical protein